MTTNGRRTITEDLADVRRRIEEWRRTRPKHCAMPEPLWAAAAAVAERDGAWRVAQALRVNHTSLKARMAVASERGGTQATASGVRFVEVRPAEVAWPEANGGIIELSSADGSKLVIRTGSSDRVDVLGLAEAFWSRRA